jgi:serine/threonine protein kinase
VSLVAWAFGVVLCEMVTGTRLFEGENVTNTLASIVRDEPDLDRVPAPVRRPLRRCLKKDPRARLRDIGDVFSPPR